MLNVLGIVFTVLTFYFQYDFSRDTVGLERGAETVAMAQALFFPFMAAFDWALVGIYSAAVDNCNLIFDTCYSDPAQTTVTTTVISSNYWLLSWFYFVLAALFIAIAFVMIMSFLSIARKRKRQKLNTNRAGQLKLPSDVAR